MYEKENPLGRIVQPDQQPLNAVHSTPQVVVSAEGDTIRDAAAAATQAAVATHRPPYRLRLHLGYGSVPSLRRWVTVTVDVVGGAS